MARSREFDPGVGQFYCISGVGPKIEAAGPRLSRSRAERVQPGPALDFFRFPALSPPPPLLPPTEHATTASRSVCYSPSCCAPKVQIHPETPTLPLPHGEHNCGTCARSELSHNSTLTESECSLD